MEAHLYLGDQLGKILSISSWVEQIRIAGTTPLPSLFSSSKNQSTADIGEIAPLNIYVYKFIDRIDYDKFKYIFSHIEASSLPRDYETSSLDIGFVEPNENVNLDKLKKKLRNNINLKQKLLEYYKRG